ncbi:MULTISPECIES: invasion associated locus B family protein [Actibacterium]|uniref:Uncharacterized protein n=1 Tax=Actibacterium naphthalenivorans TaxID=1614693 RepID=A0A840C674_9RHOB|nr:MULTISPECIES: invasion associated locus B family protein [Actibacterium]ALG89015.1 hypothetical protein TQ29_01120 [Actibacterium sp. EMB200-NS6]MBB4021431.1 hypothetical protein [Actibacterium naphthalenivorans]
MTFRAKFGVVAAAMAFAALGAQAQESTNRVAVMTDWNVFAEPAAAPVDCWGVAVPKETVNTDANGRIKAVRRGDILLFVTYRPKDKVLGQVSFLGGYPFAPESFVTVEIGDKKFEMFTDGEYAFALPEDDTRILDALKNGVDAVVTGRSSRGTITKDTFSLLGFTAASEAAQKYCGG